MLLWATFIWSVNITRCIHKLCCVSASVMCLVVVSNLKSNSFIHLVLIVM